MKRDRGQVKRGRGDVEWSIEGVEEKRRSGVEEKRRGGQKERRRGEEEEVKKSRRRRK